MNILGHGVYGLSEAARLTGLEPGRAREWFRGRKDGVRKPVFLGDYPGMDGDRAISFHDLVELFVAGKLRDRGVSLQTIRKVHERLQADLKTSHPFCRREILTRGGRIFTLGLDDHGREEMIEALTNQRVFPDVLRPFLERIDYHEATAMARRWSIADRVVVDPAICLGKPAVDGVGIATAVLAAAYEANDRDAELVADWYKINAGHVLAAVEFERSIAA